ncbi:MAG: flavodoxin family protein [Burkholderiaceae bacterium]
MNTVAVVYHSGYGHTRRLAEALAQGAGQCADVRVELMPVEKIDEQAWRTLASAAAIVFGSPTYMGGPSAPFKAFADASAKVFMTQGWRDKIAGGFTCSGQMSGDKLATLQAFSLLAMQHGMIWVGPAQPVPAEPGDPDAGNRLGSWLGLMAQADNVPPDESPPDGDLESARDYGRRLAGFAIRLRG